ncbi:MAG: DoxX family membrane protein [Verrucomicrobia bacterium]|nr:DoxX family membrane protein [Verrucomicrobiota bacterium]
MSNRTLIDAVSSKPILGKGLVKWERFAMLYARFALGTAFLSAVAGRFGIWGENTGPDSFKHFIEYTAEVNSFMPAFTIPFLAWTATIAETFLGIALILGIWLRFVVLAAAGLLVLFGSAMAISLGIKSPLDYSVFSASAGALLLARRIDSKTK